MSSLAGAMFTTVYVDHKVGLPGVNVTTAAAAVHAQGGLFSLNHENMYEAGGVQVQHSNRATSFVVLVLPQACSRRFSSFHVVSHSQSHSPTHLLTHSPSLSVTDSLSLPAFSV